MEWLIVIALILLGILIGCVLFWLFAMMPRIGKNRPSWNGLSGFDYAHRGFYTQNQSIPENSLEGFRRAVDNGFGIELDVQLTADGQVVVFHDKNLERMTGDKRDLQSLTLQELQQLPLKGTAQRISLFSEVLQTVNGKTPLIVEIKYYGNYDELCKKTDALLKNYQGAWCIESFYPQIVRWFKKNHPEAMRGQLMMDYRGSGELNRPLGFLARNLFTNFLTRPDFVAYHYQDRNNVSLRCCKKLFGVREVSWTLHSKDELETVKKDGGLGIFEHFDPRE